MHEYNQKRNDGFTLIELLISIAIMALLFTIVFAAIKDVRQKAENTARNRLASEYATALALFRDSNTNEGYPSDYVNSNVFFCLGLLPSENCQGGVAVGSTELNDKIEAYIPGPPADENPVPYAGLNLQGITYRCSALANGNCRQYEMLWYLIGDYQDCIKGAIARISPSGITICGYPQ